MSERNVTVRLNVTANTRGVDDYKNKMNEAKTTTEQMGTKASETSGFMSGLGGAIAGAFTVGAALKVAQMGIQMNDLGRDVNGVRAQFAALVEGEGSVPEIMETLREATMGQASDLTIQSGANMLMKMGIANSPEELEQILGMITRLKSPTADLGTEIQNFSLMMANQSVLRLDSFGLSGARVRDRINELLASGQALNRDEAFKMATLEEGAKAIDRLGSSAEVANTAVGRLETGVQNFVEGASSRVATGVEGTVGLIEIGLGLHPEQARQAEERAAEIGERASDALRAAMVRTDITITPEQAAAFTESMATVLQDNPALMANPGELWRQASSQIMGREMSADGQIMSGGVDITAQTQMLAQITIEAEQRRQAAAAAEEQAAAQEALNAQVEESARLFQEQEAADRRAAQAGELVDELYELQALAQTELPEFMTADQAANFNAAAERAQELVDEMERLDEVNPDMFTDDQIENAKLAAEEVGKLAKDADAAAKAFADIKLSEVFGQSQGGLEGQVSDVVVEQMRAQGATDEEIAAFQRASDLSSGRETESSLQFQEEIAPTIAGVATELGPDVAAMMTSAIAETFAQAALEGIDTNSPEFQEAMSEAFGGGMDIEGFDPSEFLTGFTQNPEDATAVAEQTALIAADTALTAENATTLAVDSETVAAAMAETSLAAGKISGSLALVRTDFGEIKTAVTETIGQLSAMTSKKWRLVLDLDVIDNLGVLPLLARLGPAGFLAREIENNGGVVPGTGEGVGLS